MARTLRPSDDDVRDHVVGVATALSQRLADITHVMRDVLATRIGELDGDKQILDLLDASIEGNVSRILHILERSLDVAQIDPPVAAIEYARRLAQRGVPVSALVRAYRLGQQNLLQAAYAESQSRGDTPLVQSLGYEAIVTLTFDYIDWISQQVVTIYEEERERWLADRNTVRRARVEEIIDGTSADLETTEAAIGYRLRPRHLGVILWVDETGTRQDQVSRFSGTIAAVSNCVGAARQPLVIARDRASTWAWIPVHDTFVFDADRITSAVTNAAAEDEGPLPMLAFGRPAFGLDGFRRTHLDAVQAQRVATIGGATGPVISYSDPDMSIAALLTANLEDTRAWVAATLGDLAHDTEQHERLRETLRLFLHHDGSYTGTAEAMLMHKNSVKYRVDSAEKVIGRKIRSDRQAIELALTACHWLGPAVLQEQ